MMNVLIARSDCLHDELWIDSCLKSAFQEDCQPAGIM